jgi:hypothetical protein
VPVMLREVDVHRIFIVPTLKARKLRTVPFGFVWRAALTSS